MKNPLKLPVDIRLRIVRNLRALREAMKDVDSVKDQLIKTHGKNDSISPEMPGWEPFRVAHEELMGLQTPVAIETVTVSDLDIETNELPLSLIDQWMASEDALAKEVES